MGGDLSNETFGTLGCLLPHASHLIVEAECRPPVLNERVSVRRWYV